MKAKKIISEQAARALEVMGCGLNDDKRKMFVKFFEDVCLSENWIRIRLEIDKEMTKKV